MKRLHEPFAESDFWCGDVGESSQKVIGRLAQLRGKGVTRAGGLDELIDSLQKTTHLSKTAEEYLDWLLDAVLPYCINLQSTGCLAHMTGNVPGFVPVLAQLLAELNQNLAKQQASRGFSVLEQDALAEIHRLIYGFPEDFYRLHRFRASSTLGVMAGGGTIANMTAIWVARNQVFPTNAEFEGVEPEGLPAALRFYGWQDAVVVGSDLVHYSFEKAMSHGGFGSRNLIRVPVDNGHHLDPGALEARLAELKQAGRKVIAIVGIAGTTDSGSIDPLEKIGQIALKEEIHFHVDAAWGGPLLFSGRRRRMLAGIELADTVTIDGHKQMHLPIGTSMLLFRNPALASVIEKRSNYMLQDGSGDLGCRSLEGSRDGASIFVHAALSIIGSSGYEFLVEAGFTAAGRMAESIRGHPAFQLLMEPETNIVLYRFLPTAYRARPDSLDARANERVNWINQTMQQTEFEGGRTLVSRTTIKSPFSVGGEPIVALRAVMNNPLVRQADIDDLLDEQMRIADGIASREEYSTMDFSSDERAARLSAGGAQ